MAISNLEKINLNGHEVLIVNTNSTNEEFLERFVKLKGVYQDFIFKSLDYTCWDSGAYIYSIQNFKSDKYIFLQDSLEILDKNYIVYFDELLDNYDVVPHCEYDYQYRTYLDEIDNTYKPIKEIKDWIEDGIIFESYPPKGIFGPIFGAKSELLNKIPNKWLKHPRNKDEGMSMENRWSLMFHSLNAKKMCLEDIMDMRYIKKYFPYRG